MQQPEGPAQIHERHEEQQAERDPDVGRVQLAGEGALVAARHRPRHLVAGPLLQDRAALVVDEHLHDLVAVAKEADLPAPRALRVGGRVEPALLALLAYLLSARRDPLDLLRAQLEEAWRLGLRRRAHRLDVGARRGRQRQRQDDDRYESQCKPCAAGRAGCFGPQSLDSSMRKLHILFPMKLSGVATTIEIACAGSSGRPATLHEQLEHERGEQEGRHADREEASGLEAGVAAARAEGPVAVPPEVVRHRDDERERRRDEVVQVEDRHAEGEHGQVDHVAGRADSAELDQLQPVVRLAEAGAHAQVNRVRALGDHGPGLLSHPAEGTPKCRSTSGVTSVSDHCSRSGTSSPLISRTPSESSRWSEPWLPPPT